MTNYVKKEDNKKDKIINGIVIGIVILIVGAIAIMVSNNKKLGASNIKEISYSEYKEKIKDDNYTIVLLASPTCYHCQEYKPFVNVLAEENNFTVYYLNVHSEKLTEEEYNELHDNISATKEQFNSSGGKVIPTPTTIILKNGEEVNSILGDIGYDGLKKFLQENEVI